MKKQWLKLCFGKINPNGKLAETYPNKLEETPCFENFPGTELSVEYKESIYVGYRYYDKNRVNVLFPFGYGLSYTKFKYTSLSIEQKGNTLEVSFKIKNIGDYKGKEIAELYVSQKNPSIFKAEKELKGFKKVELEPGEEKKVTIKLNREAFEYYNVETRKWSVEEGVYNIMIGKSSQAIVLNEEIIVKSDDEKVIKKYPKVYYTGNIKKVTDEDFEELLGHKIPNRHLKIEDITEENTLEQMIITKVGKYIYEAKIEESKKLLNEQRINEAAEVIMNMQKPVKRYVKDAYHNITKEMIKELVEYARENKDGFENIEFVKEYLK